MNAEYGMLNPLEEVYAGLTVAYLHRCTSEGSAFFAEILSGPQAGSIAELSLRDRDLMEPILMAGMYLHVAVDHYLTLQSMFVPAQVPLGAPVPTVRNYSPYTIVRGAVEADAWACWLLDPSLLPTQRLARAMTVRALNLREVRRLGLADHYDDRIVRVSAVAALHNLEAKRNSDDEIVWVGEPRPDMTKLLSELLPEQRADTNGEPLGGHTYALLSARAHGAPWAVLHNAKQAASSVPYSAIAELAIDVVELMRLASISLRLHSEAICRAGLLDGRTTIDWETRRGPTAESKLAAAGI